MKKDYKTRAARQAHNEEVWRKILYGVAECEDTGKTEETLVDKSASRRATVDALRKSMRAELKAIKEFENLRGRLLSAEDPQKLYSQNPPKENRHDGEEDA